MNRRAFGLSLLVVGCLFSPWTHALSPKAPPNPAAARSWDEVQDIEARAQSARIEPYDSFMGRWLLTPDGRFAIVNPASEEHGMPASAVLGRHRLDGHWLELSFDGAAIDLAGMKPEHRAKYEAWQEQVRVESEADEVVETQNDSAPSIESDSADVPTDEGADRESESDGGEGDLARQRYLRLPYRGGELLVADHSLAMIASQWKGEGPLKVMPMAWRIPGFTRDPEDYSFDFEIDDPLRANLPWELTRLLRPEAIESRVTEVRESHDDLKWKHQTAAVHLRLDRGETHGLYPEMNVYGLPPDDDVYGRIVEVQPDHAIARIQVQRFSPREQPRLPSVGLRVTTRSTKGGACALDFSAALRGSVLSVRTPADKLEWDEEGYAWFELSLDQGRMQGLSVGDKLYAEDDEIDGEGRVVSTDSERSVVLWRVQRYGEVQGIRLPRRDSKLVTSAWKRAEWDVFRDVPGLGKAAVSE